MNRRAKTSAVVLAAALAVLVPGCGNQQAVPQAGAQAVNHSGAARPVGLPNAPASATSAPLSAPLTAEPERGAGTAEAATARPERAGDVPVENVPTELPPGDPGLDAPSVPDPGVPAHDRGHEEPARTTVPTEAMLDGSTVSAVLGGDWRDGDAQAPAPVAPADAVAERTTVFVTDSGDVSGELVQTVATHRSLAAADRAVLKVGRRLTDAGWTELADPRLGTASVAVRSRDGSQTAVVISAEAVTVVLVGAEAATANPGRWVSLLDVALGSSCAAAPHGCH